MVSREGEKEYSYWLSCSKFTVYVRFFHGGYIVKTAPIVGRFVGQNMKDLLSWVEYRFKHVILVDLDTMEKMYP
jgi:hypothetical protein